MIVIYLWIITEHKFRPVGYVARRYSSRGELIVDLNQKLNFGDLDSMRQYFIELGCSIVPKSIGLITEIWIEPDSNKGMSDAS